MPMESTVNYLIRINQCVDKLCYAVICSIYFLSKASLTIGSTGIQGIREIPE